VKLIIHVHLVSRLRVSVAIPPPPLAFAASTGTTLLYKSPLKVTVRKYKPHQSAISIFNVISNQNPT